MAGMEELLMGGDSSGSDDSDAEDIASKAVVVAAPQATASTAAPTPTPTAAPAPAAANTTVPKAAAPISKPPVVSAVAVPVAAAVAVPVAAAAVPKPIPVAITNTKSDLTSRLKNLYTSPPAPKAATPAATPAVAAAVPAQVVKVGLGVGGAPPPPKPTTAAATAPQRRVPSVPMPLVARTNVAPTNAPVAVAAPVAAATAPPPAVSSRLASNNSNYIPPMVHTNHHGSPVHQRQPLQPVGTVPQPVVLGSTIGRVPAPLPKARTSNRSVPPSNRIASVPALSRPSPAAQVVNMPSGPPPPSPLTNSQQGSNSRQQYGHAPHLQRGAGGAQQQQQRPVAHSSSQPQQQQQHVLAASQPRQQMQQPAPSRNIAIAPNVVPPDSATSRSSSGLNNQMTDQEKKEKERFLMFTRVLMKYLEQRDASMHAKAKAQIKECYEKNKSGDPAFRSLTISMKARLHATVGESYWKKAHDYLDHFLKQKKEQKAKQDVALQQGQQQQPGMPAQASSMHGGVPPPIVRTQVRPSVSGSAQQQQQHLITQSQAAAAQKMPISTTSRSAPGVIKPPSTIPIPVPTSGTAGAIATATVQPISAEQLKAKKDAQKAAEQIKRKAQRNAQAREKRAAKKKEKEAAAKTSTGQVAIGAPVARTVTGLPMRVGITHSATVVQPSALTMVSAPGAIPTASVLPTSSATSITSTASSIKAKDKKVEVIKKKKKKVVAPSVKSSSMFAKKKGPSNRLMETIDHATLMDLKTLPSIFTSKEYKIDVNLDEEQRMLLYGDEKQRTKVKDITKAASAALDTVLDANDRDAKLKEAGVPPLPWRLPSVYDGWGKKNVVSVRTAWAKARLPESDMQRAEIKKEELERARRERPMDAQSMPPAVADHAPSPGVKLQEGSAAAIAAALPKIENDTTNHVWFNETRAEQDPTLALISEATEAFLKTAIEKAIGQARLRQNLDGVRLWHTLQAHSAVPNNGIGDNKQAPPPALIRLGCDVRRQIALSEGNAAKTYQRMEEAISRQTDTYHHSTNDNAHDPEKMLLESTSMADLSKKPPLKAAAQTADEDAKRKFAVFGGIDSMEPPLGRVPKKAKVTLQDIAVGTLGNRTSMIVSRRKRFRVGLKY